MCEKKWVYIYGKGSGYIYKQAPDEKKRLENQSGVWKKFYGGNKDTRSFRWSDKATPPVRTSFDHFVDNTGHGQNSYTAAREAAAVINQEEMDRRRAQHQLLENAVRFKINVDRINRNREERAMAMREARTTFEQLRLKRQADLRDANAAIMIGKMYRGHRTRGEFKKALQAKARAEGVSEAEIVRIVGKALHTPLQNLDDAVQLFSQFNPDELRGALAHLVQRVEDLEAAKGATTHFSMVKGAGEDVGLEEVKGVPVEMPKHTKRRDHPLVLLKMRILLKQKVLEKQNLELLLFKVLLMHQHLPNLKVQGFWKRQ